MFPVCCVAVTIGTDTSWLVSVIRLDGSASGQLEGDAHALINIQGLHDGINQIVIGIFAVQIIFRLLNAYQLYLPPHHLPANNGLCHPTSRHYGDSIIGFAITIFIWAFALAAIYKATKSVIACAIYHSFIDAIGAVYDWNLLFDSFPGNIPANVYRVVWLLLAVALWFIADRREKQTAQSKAL